MADVPINLSRLIEMAKTVKMSESQELEQRHSFVFGNTRTENESITWDQVEEVGRSLDHQGQGRPGE